MNKFRIEVKRPILGPITASEVVVELKMRETDANNPRFPALMEVLDLVNELWGLRCNSAAALKRLAQRIERITGKEKELDSIYYQLDGPSRGYIFRVGKEKFLEKTKKLEEELTKN